MFEKLIEAARTCHESGNPIDECCIEGCPNFDSQPYCLDQILKDCVEALTQSSAELKDKDYLIQHQADEIERLRQDVKKQQEKMFKLAKRLPHWVSVEDELPEPNIQCLVRDDDNNCAVGYYRQDERAWDSPFFGWVERDDEYYEDGDLCRIGKVVAWMPIEPPQEVQDGK